MVDVRLYLSGEGLEGRGLVVLLDVALELQVYIGPVLGGQLCRHLAPAVAFSRQNGQKNGPEVKYCLKLWINSSAAKLGLLAWKLYRLMAFMNSSLEAKSRRGPSPTLNPFAHSDSTTRGAGPTIQHTHPAHIHRRGISILSPTAGIKYSNKYS